MAGGDYFFGKVVNRWDESNVGTTAGVTVTHAAESGYKHVCVGIQCSGDAAAVVTVESPAATVLWRKRFTGAFNHSESFERGTVVGAEDGALLVKISASTANCEANIQGLTIRG